MTEAIRYNPHNPDADPSRPVNQKTPINSQVALFDYDPAWRAMFQVQADRIRAALGDRALQVEHIGSTSVPGLIAKPCIDIALVVDDAGDDDAYVPDLQRVGYVLRISEVFHNEPHRVFKASDMNVNMHVHSKGSSEAAREIAFRDWLRSHPEDRDRYAEAKREIASRTWQYIQDYADAKDAIVAEIMARMRETERSDAR